MLSPYQSFKKNARRKNDLYITSQDLQDLPTPTQKKSKRAKKIILSLLGVVVLLVGIGGYGTFLFLKVHRVSQQISTNKPSLTDDLRATASLLKLNITESTRESLQGEKSGRINILLLGAAGKHDAGSDLTDTIMLMSIDSRNKKISLLSLPRDLYVRIPKTNAYTKINSLYAYGLRSDAGPQYIIQSVEEITGQTVNYHLIVNYDAFREIIDSIGGIHVTVQRDILDTRFPGPNYSYETFEIKKGFHTLDGNTALKYVRERHDDPEGDFGRAKRQQQVIQAVKNRLFSVQTLFNVLAINKILDSVGKNIRTDMALTDIESFLELSKEIDMQNINNVVIDAWKKDSLLKVSHVDLGGVRAFILVPRVGNYSEIKQSAETIFDANANKDRTERIASENARITIINRSGNRSLESKIYDLLKNKMSFSQTNIFHEPNPGEKLSQTIIIDHSQMSKLYTLDTLIKKLPATLSQDTSRVSADDDIMILLGSDLIDAYRYDDDSLDDFNNAQDNQASLNFLN